MIWKELRKSEVENAFASASNLLEYSGKAEEIGSAKALMLFVSWKFNPSTSLIHESVCFAGRTMVVMLCVSPQMLVGYYTA